MSIKPLHNEQELLVKVAQGDQRAFTELFDNYYKVLGQYVFRVTDSLPVAEEIVQDAFVTVWTKRENLPEINSFSNYLFIICRNKAYDQLRRDAGRHRLQKELEHYLQEDANDDPDPADQYHQWIDDAVNKLPPQAQKVYLLSRHGRLKHEEIAARLHISPETVKKHIQYAVSFIKKDVSAHIELCVLAVLMIPLILN